MLALQYPNSPSLGALREELDTLFGRAFGLSSDLARRPERSRQFFPALNIWEENEQVMVEAEVPGMREEDLEVYVLDRELTIKGQLASVSDESNKVHKQERVSGAFTRSLRLPIEVDGERVSAALKNGVLTICLPKTEAAKPKRITVRPSS